MEDSHGLDDTQAALSLIQRIIENILAQPQESKFRHVDPHSSIFEVRQLESEPEEKQEGTIGASQEPTAMDGEDLHPLLSLTVAFCFVAFPLAS